MLAKMEKLAKKATQNNDDTKQQAELNQERWSSNFEIQNTTVVIFEYESFFKFLEDHTG